MWSRLHELLEMPNKPGTDYLRCLQEYIAVTPPNDRCPCRHGVRLLITADHFPGCLHTTQQERMLRYMERRAAIQQRRPVRNREEKQAARTLQEKWRRRVLKQLPRAELRKMKRQLEALLH